MWRVKKLLVIGHGYHKVSIQETLGGSCELEFDSDPRHAVRMISDTQGIDNGFDAIMLDIKTCSAEEFGIIVNEARKKNGDMIVPPVMILTTENEYLSGSMKLGQGDVPFMVFAWEGDCNIMKNMKKLIEDRRRVDEPYSLIVLLVEDQPRFYSNLLVTLNERYGDRALILLARTYEEAIGLIDKYGKKMIGIVTDVQIPKEGRLEDAGFYIASRSRMAGKGLVVIQSSDLEMWGKAVNMGCDFLHKGSRTFLTDLLEILDTNAGFGDFVFRNPNRVEVGRAADLREFISAIRRIPIESLVYHASDDHFSTWLYLRDQVEVANKIKDLKVGDYEKRGLGWEENLRRDIVSILETAISNGSV